MNTYKITRMTKWHSTCTLEEVISSCHKGEFRVNSGGMNGSREYNTQKVLEGWRQSIDDFCTGEKIEKH